MARLTTDWTDRHVSVAVAVLAAGVTGGLAALADLPYSLVGLGALALTVLVALSLDAFGGIVAGLLGAAVLIAARQLGNDWTSEDFGLALALTLALVAVGWSTGQASSRLRARPDERSSATAAPAFGSLGLLSAELAMARLDEEVARAQRHTRPLTVVLFITEVSDPLLPAPARVALHRTVARLVESLVPSTAVPFALAPAEVGAILPETDEPTAWELVGPVVDAAGRASFALREQDERRSLEDCAELHVGLVALSASHPDADALVSAARAAVHGDRPAQVPPVQARSSPS